MKSDLGHDTETAPGERHYRPDIDGLRAIAVVSVVAFHAFPNWMPGGFVGVDIFFVISGYLIASILHRAQTNGDFSIVSFYERRVRRIFPPLIAVLGSVSVVGWLFLWQDDYRRLSKHIFASAAFVVNFVFMRESGYFETSAAEKPLLHLWSLAIEEQFYIVFPLFLWAMIKARAKPLFGIALVGLVSFSLSVETVRARPDLAFYMPQLRAWELLSGAFLAVLGQVAPRTSPGGANDNGEGTFIQSLRIGTMLTGLLLLGLGFLLIKGTSLFPGWWALLPVTGTVLLIASGGKTWFAQRVLAQPLMVSLGRISYPLYLWHWPTLVLAKAMAPEGSLSVFARGFAVRAALGLATLTYVFVEQPLRYGVRGRAKCIGLLVTMAAISLVGLGGYTLGGYPTLPTLRLGADQLQAIKDLEKAAAIGDADAKSMPCFQLLPRRDFGFFAENGCLPKQPAQNGRPIIMLIGDSHAAALSLGLRSWAQEHGTTSFYITSGVFPLFVDEGVDAEYIAFRKRTYDAIKQIKPDLLIVDTYWYNQGRPGSFRNSGSWPDYEHYLTQEFRHISSLGARQVLIVGQLPVWKGSLPDVLMNNFAAKGKDIPDYSDSGLEAVSFTTDAMMRRIHYPENVRYVSLIDALCRGYKCLTHVGDDLLHDLTVWDYGHLTRSGANYVMDIVLGDAIRGALAQPQ